MKKQFTKIKIAAENLSRSTKPDRKDSELETIEKQVEKYRDVLDKLVRKLPTVPNSSSSNASGSADLQERDKRIKKQAHYKIGQALEESSKELSKDMPLHHVLMNCGELEKSIAECIVDSELETECEVVRRLKFILDNEIQEISTLKRNVSRTLQEYASLKRNYEAAIRLDEPMTKINHIKDQQEQCEIKLEKERDSWAAQMFELIAKEDIIVQCIRDYVLNQRNYHERSLQKVNASLANIQDIIQSTVKSRFGTPLADHLESTNCDISYIIELCACCLIENGLCEEGLMRVGCASTKLRRMKHALEAQYVKTPLPLDYQDPHVIGSILKLYLRELPEPLLTFKCYQNFIKAAEKTSEEERKIEIKKTLAKLPTANYLNLRYLTKFLWVVTQNVDFNKMSSHNLAIVMSPNMLWPRVDKNNPADYMGQVNSSSAVNIIVELLISQWDYFFEGEVDFYVTLQRSKLFVEDKSKSNSFYENMERSDADIAESPRFGTIRRQKPCAPSPPTKLQNAVSTDPSGSSGAENTVTYKNNGESQHNNHQRGPKELFPSTGSGSGVVTNNNNNNNNGNSSSSSNSSGGHTEKPEIPPLPKKLLLQQQQQQQQLQQTQPETNTITNSQQALIAAKPVPMTRTQFFGLDNLPSPTDDRKSNDSVGSLNLKPDLPQKPKIPKRPMVLNLNSTTGGGCVGGGSKSDEESTPTNVNQQNIPDIASTAVTIANCPLRGHRTAEQLVQEHCDNVTALQANIGSSNTSIPSALLKENNHNNHLTIDTTNQASSEVNANAVPPPPSAVTVAKVMTININNSNNSLTSSTNTAIATTTSASASSTHTDTPSAETRLKTPTTPASPNVITPLKRPTVPAPPPPTSVKKQQQQHQQQQEETYTTTKSSHHLIAPKPVPQKRTQFLSLDNLPSPTVDRSQSDFLNFKTQRKRLMFMGLNSTTGSSGITVGGGKTREETNEEATPPISAIQYKSPDDIAATVLRGHKTVEQLAQEHCEKVTALQANIGSSNTSIPSALLKENKPDNNLLSHTAKQSNLEINAKAMAPPSPAVNVEKVMIVNTDNSNNSLTLPAPTADIHSQKPKAALRLRTIKSPASPNTPKSLKRPTMPAPLPPTSAKKQVE